MENISKRPISIKADATHLERSGKSDQAIWFVVLNINDGPALAKLAIAMEMEFSTSILSAIRIAT